MRAAIKTAGRSDLRGLPGVGVRSVTAPGPVPVEVDTAGLG
ncbi:hypothetical protein [Amycolatopsis acidiphila]|nr:hypothetical protein [Amycolatopsis acidiphila]GHG97038.1 hypothetical protein GCM10017788_76370 [Amycolatopsis acidiphila]